MKYNWSDGNVLESQGLITPTTGVILIDMQEKFVPKIFPDEKREEIIRNQVTILRECQDQDIPVAYLEFVRYGKTIPELQEELDLVPRNKGVEKSWNNGFVNSELEELLRNHWSLEKVVLMGINADYCVQSTGKGAIGCGLEIYTSKALIGGQEHHGEPNMHWYSNNGNVF